MIKSSVVKLIFFSCVIVTFLNSCKKAWLEAKPTKALTIPHTLADYKSLMASTKTFGGAFNDRYGTFTEHSSADFIVNTATWNNNNATPLDRNFYKWEPDVWKDAFNYSPWELPYSNILYTNVVLEGIETIIPANNNEQLDWYQVKGAALFFRAAWHYDVAKQFCKAYNESTASTDPGIPLRLNADFNEVSVRSTVKQSYDQILDDLKSAGEILPVSTPINLTYKCLPTKTAVYAMLARVYLSMSSYDSAHVYADKTLQMYNALINFSSEIPNPDNFTPIARFNKEVILHMTGGAGGFLRLTSLYADTTLYQSYNDKDLRKKVFFLTYPPVPIYRLWKGSYDGGISGDLFTGLATDEMYLIRAECYARKGNKDAALNDLNTLMVNRWANDGTWVPFTAIDTNEALQKILIERRKELCFRSLRWTDLKRLNMEPQFRVDLTKMVLGATYTLSYNSPLYVFSIPPNVIALTGMQQNPR